ncbi:trypsin-like peptidase domain-containing protein [Opitutales bacterium]|nr:trypsin-like peptidase domain-containing protein [Opitutales bacterium]
MNSYNPMVILFRNLLVLCLTLQLFEESSLFSKERTNDPFAHLAAIVKPSVVTISSVNRGGGPWGVGTGFVVDAEGVIATNFHVIGEHREFTVELADGTLCKPTEILAIDRSRDLALFRIDQSGLPTLPLGDSSKIEPGQAVLSVGNPLGYDLSVSQGVVAAIRELEFGDGRPMVQVAIPIEAGSSGSPVVDRNGKVLAMLTIKSGGAMGFGVPANALRSLMGEIRPIPIKRWLTVGMLDDDEWVLPLGGNWRQRAGIIKASGMGDGFGGRMICLAQQPNISPPFDLEVEVRLEDESGAAGLVFGSDGEQKHYGFYPTNGSLRLTCFNGPKVFDWNIIETIPSPDYLPGTWNRLKIRFDQGGQIRCSINEQEVIEAVDFTLKKGWVGLCKFREPAAEFRNFRISARLSSGSITPEIRELAYELSQTLVLEKSISPSEVQDLTKLDSSVYQALIDRAVEMEQASERLRQSAEKVRIARIIKELTDLLTSEKTESEEILLRSALLVSLMDNPDFQLKQYLDRVDRMATRIAQKIPKQISKRETLDILIDELFVQLGYHGSTLDFHHRSNSYLNEVIDDREGLPITLTLLLLELGKRIDLPITGLATPGHFLALYREPGQKLKDSVIIDAFSGRTISREYANTLTHSELSDKDFMPASETEIINRILRNLLRSADWDRDSSASLRYLDALVSINPNDRYHRTLRAMTHYGLGSFVEALIDINYLIDQDPQDPANAPLIEIKRRLMQSHEQIR